ncbi:NRDE family protein [Mesobacillus harenae]|uniref:NRDE family protein n=1 Tax=Mesobacillus harenae TaxID=2213203 RepID=UPI00157FF461|nr:NRDE family protein [Mesobacillus harenae]
MCLVLFAYKLHPEYKLIVAANRDEFYGRPTAPAHFWQDQPEILAGRDLNKMGTWLGVTTTGRFSALTNYRDPNEKSEGKRSRGELVADFLRGEQTPFQYMESVAADRDRYPGYNLLAGDNQDLYYYSNIQNQITKVEPGIYGLSNHFLNTEWPKVEQGRKGLSEIVKGTEDEMTEKIFSLLQVTDPVPDENLPQTGVSLEWERILSPMFIRANGYGTRSSAVLMATDEIIQFTEMEYIDNSANRQQFKVHIV